MQARFSAFRPRIIDGKHIFDLDYVLHYPYEMQGSEGTRPATFQPLQSIGAGTPAKRPYESDPCV